MSSNNNHNNGLPNKDAPTKAAPAPRRASAQKNRNSTINNIASKMNRNTTTTTTTDTNVVKELGRRARERLAQQQSQRKEIVRLEGAVLPPPPARHQKPPPKRRSSTKPLIPRPKRQRRTTTGANNNRKRTQMVDPNFDPWMPDVSHVTQCHGANHNDDEQYDDDDDNNHHRHAKSTVVMLHGLPKGTTPWQIKRFFAGLQPRQIGILLPCPLEISIWDAKPRYDKTNKKMRQKEHFSFGMDSSNDEDGSSASDDDDDKEIERYPPTFRVVVKFDSAPAAELAADRSGEPIETAIYPKQPPPPQKDKGTTDKDDATNKNHRQSHKDMTDDASPKKAALGVTHMIKAHANFILQKLVLVDTMATPVTNNHGNNNNNYNKTPLHHISSQVEKDMLPDVHRILWMDAQRRFRFWSSPMVWRKSNSKQNDLLFTCWPLSGVAAKSQGAIFDPSSSSSNNNVNAAAQNEQHDQLVCVRNGLRTSLPFPSAQILDPFYLSYPTIRLAKEALAVVNQMITVIEERRLVRHREQFFFGKNRD